MKGVVEEAEVREHLRSLCVGGQLMDEEMAGWETALALEEKPGG